MIPRHLDEGELLANQATKKNIILLLLNNFLILFYYSINIIFLIFMLLLIKIKNYDHKKTNESNY